MSLILRNLIISNLIDEEFEDDTFITIDYCSIEVTYIDKFISFFDAFTKNKLKSALFKIDHFLNPFFFHHPLQKRSFLLHTFLEVKAARRIISFMSYRLVSYVIAVSFLRNDIMIHAMDIRGSLKVFCSVVSTLKIVDKRPKIRPKIISKLFNYFLKNIVYFNDKAHIPVALHFKNVPKNDLKLITKMLKHKFDIRALSYFSYRPHNGCRPRKVRRIKHRTRKPM